MKNEVITFYIQLHMFATSNTEKFSYCGLITNGGVITAAVVNHKYEQWFESYVSQ
jgi:hypothetical protein